MKKIEIVEGGLGIRLTKKKQVYIYLHGAWQFKRDREEVEGWIFHALELPFITLDFHTEKP